jgi:hypothetical protein
VGSAEDDTARAAGGRLGSSEAEGLRWAMPTLEWRVFATGSDGNGPVGGASEGREGRGSVVLAMVMSDAKTRFPTREPGCCDPMSSHSCAIHVTNLKPSCGAQVPGAVQRRLLEPTQPMPHLARVGAGDGGYDV